MIQKINKIIKNQKHGVIDSENIFIIDYKNQKMEVCNNEALKLFKKIGTYRYEAPFSSWTRKLFTNHCLDYLKSAYKKHIYYEASLPDEILEIVDEDIEQDNGIEIEKLMELMQQLPIGYRTVLNLYAIEKYNHQQIAEVLGINAKSSRSQLVRARRALKLLIEKNSK